MVHPDRVLRPLRGAALFEECARSWEKLSTQTDTRLHATINSVDAHGLFSNWPTLNPVTFRRTFVQTISSRSRHPVVKTTVRLVPLSRFISSRTKTPAMPLRFVIPLARESMPWTQTGMLQRSSDLSFFRDHLRIHRTPDGQERVEKQGEGFNSGRCRNGPFFAFQGFRSVHRELLKDRKSKPLQRDPVLSPFCDRQLRQGGR